MVVFNCCLGQFPDLQLGAMLDDRKLSARALFDANSQRQILTGVRVEVGKSVCHTLPFHVFVSLYNTDRQIFWLFVFLLYLHLCLFDLQDTADYIRPISFTLNFKINDTDSGPVLDEGWPTTLKRTVSSIRKSIKTQPFTYVPVFMVAAW